MKKTLAVLLAATIILLSSGCDHRQEIRKSINDHDARATHPLEQIAETETGEVIIGEGSQPQPFEDMQWVYKPDGEGSMLCMITNVRAVKNDRDFDGNCFDDDGGIILVNPEYTQERFRRDPEKYPHYLFRRYPDSVDENGDLLDGCLILVDLTVKNIDATNQFFSDQTGEMTSLEEDIYIFRANAFIYLMNRTPKEYTLCKNAVYYSDIWNMEEHPMKFRLEPGETTSFQIGFLTNGPSGAWRLKDDLVLYAIQNDSLDGIWFPLDLEVPEA